jgi:hypothetical protein
LGRVSLDLRRGRAGRTNALSEPPPAPWGAALEFQPAVLFHCKYPHRGHGARTGYAKARSVRQNVLFAMRRVHSPSDFRRAAARQRDIYIVLACFRYGAGSLARVAQRKRTPKRVRFDGLPHANLPRQPRHATTTSNAYSTCLKAPLTVCPTGPAVHANSRHCVCSNFGAFWGVPSELLRMCSDH